MNRSYRLATIAAAALTALSVSGCATARGKLDRFNAGYLAERENALQAIKDASGEPGQANYSEVRSGAAELYTAYTRRAERQQAFLDFGSAATFVGAAGAFEGGLSSSTRTAWAIAAFTPSVVTQFNAYEPTRELFHGGGLALQLITARYDRVVGAASLANLEPPDIDCSRLADIPAEIRDKAWDSDQSILAEADRLHWACQSLKGRQSDLADAARYAEALRPWIAAHYADDVLRLDNALVGQDRQLRYTPSETLTALVASPLRAADMLLTGTNTKQAIDSIATLNAFSGLNQSLGSVSFPPLPTAIATTPPMPSALRDRLGAQATPREARAILMELEERRQQLSRRETDYSFRLQAAKAVFEAAKADRLTFHYDIATRTTVVSLGPAPVTPTATATTAAMPPGL